MSEISKSHHRFIVSNYGGIVIRCCIHCGLSHQMERYPGQQTNKVVWKWNLILEEKEDESFAKPCSVESGSDDPFPYNHFILSNHHQQIGFPIVIRFCVRCGLSHHLDWANPHTLGIEAPYPFNVNVRVPNWQHINENERDMTVSDLCPAEQGDDASKRRYLLVLKN
jgi:hypothetical protein